MLKKTNKSPLVSVILPIYNVENYLIQCLDSLVNQSLKQIEIIAIDDGSTDNSSQILKGYAKKYPNIIRAYNKKNGGLSDTRNFGINKAVGKYIGFVDSDDWIHEDMFMEMYDQAKKDNADIVACGGMKHYESKNGLNIEKTRAIEIRCLLEECGYSAIEKPNLLFAVHSYACNKIFRRKLFEEKGNLFPVGQWFEDSAVIYNILLQANKISCVPKYFYNYRVGREGAITSLASDKIFDIFKSCDSIISFYEENVIKNKEMDEVIEKLILVHIFVRFKTLFKSIADDKLLAWKFARYSWLYLDINLPGWRDKNQYILNKNTSLKWKIYQNNIKAFCYIFTPNWIHHIKHKPQQLERELRKKRKFIKKNRKTRIQQNNLSKHGFILLNDLKKIFDELNIIYFVDFGTLLGFVRDKGFMPHDLDLDIGVICTEKEKIKLAILLKKAGYKLWRSYLKENIIGNEEVVEQSYKLYNSINKKILKFDINFYENYKNYSKTWLFYMDPIQQYAPQYRSIVEMTYSRIEGIKYLDIEGNKIPIPKNSEQLLEEKYGTTWNIPDPKWVYWKSPAASKLKKFGRFITH